MIQRIINTDPVYLLTCILVAIAVFFLLMLLKHYPFVSKATDYPKAEKPTRAMIKNIKSELDRKLTYISPEMCEEIERLNDTNQCKDFTPMSGTCSRV